MNSKRIIRITFPILLLLALYFLGPEPKTPVFNLTLPQAPASPLALEQYVATAEAQHKIKPGNEAEIVWHDSTRQKTEYAIVYLHGFSASKMEGFPTHQKFAKTFGCNLYLSRLADHGIDTTDALVNFTPDRLWESAKQALAIGKQLGNKVILVSTSTGGTLALKLAAEYPDDVHALINMSPNVAINNGAAFLLNDPWGLYIVRLVKGGKYSISTEDTEEESKYWYSKYRLEATPQLEELVESTMVKETFEKIKQPCLTLYYFKNEQEQDPQVKVSAMLDMNDKLSTPADLKQAIPFPDAGGHVIGSSLTNKHYEEIYQAIEKFAVEKLGMKKI
ncbi:alpha/beta hydrolase [Ohtaekwangia koreensis]|uniref:Esterase/lipase n=1 Tax=Ohtaekwangia koreensis TaxID=688867 RepID=A0A1T5MNB1_9BACT|nr:alpha/beta hydrolase [Ohtaekwangia koreensis]SKC89717.1 Esterase/lipase [Ohtaekwangia koreensis]